MDNLMPPPNGSPEEIQAWNNMMDTMVTFIKASTHLMNTITQKVGPPPGSNALAIPNFMPDSGCEPECQVCIPKPPCGVCVAPSQRAPIGLAAPIIRAPSQIPPDSAVRSPPSVQVVEPPAAVSVIAPDDTGGAERADVPEGAENPDGGEAAEGQDGGGGEANEAAEGQDGEGGESAPDEAAPSDTPAPPEPADEPAPPEAAEEPIPPAAEEVPPPPPPADAEPPADSRAAQPIGVTGGCVCSAIRAKRLEEQKKASCVCSKKGEGAEPPPPPQEPIEERICGCGPTDGNQAALVQEMIEKLSNAQNEINQLQEEMARLQRMDTSRRTGAHGGPNPAALYREIMRDSEPRDRSSQRIPAHVRQRLFQSNSTASSSMERPPENPSNRNDPAARQRLFQTNTTADSSRSSAFNPQGNSTFQSPDDPANRIPDHLRRRLFQTNSTVDSPPSRFGNTGFELSSIPGEGRQLPEGFVGCVPCDANRPPSSLGTSSAISPIPRPMDGRVASPGPAQQQRSQYARSPQQQFDGSRQGMLNRTGQGPQYVGGASPCGRAASGGGSGFRSLASSYQPSPNSAQGGGSSGFRSLPSSYQDSPNSAQGGGGSGFRSLPTSYQDSPMAPEEGGITPNDQYMSLAGTAMYSGNASRTPGSPPVRVVICRPTPQQQNNEMSTTEISKRIDDVSKKLDEKYKEVQALEAQKSQLMNRSMNAPGPSGVAGVSSPLPQNFQPVASSTPTQQLGYSGNYDMSYSGAGTESSGWPSNTASSGGSSARRRLQFTQNSSGSGCAPNCDGSESSGQYQNFSSSGGSGSGQYQNFSTGLDYGF